MTMMMMMMMVVMYTRICRCRGQTLRVLDSNPLQVLLYFLVLLDAAVVIAEILIDLHAMRSLYSIFLCICK